MIMMMISNPLEVMWLLSISSSLCRPCWQSGNLNNEPRSSTLRPHLPPSHRPSLHASPDKPPCLSTVCVYVCVRACVRACVRRLTWKHAGGEVLRLLLGAQALSFTCLSLAGGTLFVVSGLLLSSTVLSSVYIIVKHGRTCHGGREPGGRAGLHACMASMTMVT